MSNVIKLNRIPGRVNAKVVDDEIPSFDEKPETNPIEIELHNQYTKGFSEGQRSVKANLEMEYSEKLLKKYSELNNIMIKVNETLQQYDNSFEELVINTSFLLAEKILKKELDRESIIKDVLDNTLNKVLGANDIVVRINPHDYEEIIKEGSAFKLNEAFSKIRFEKDERIEKGGCFVESEIGNADGRISSMLNELKRKFDVQKNSSNQ